MLSSHVFSSACFVPFRRRGRVFFFLPFIIGTLSYSINQKQVWQTLSRTLQKGATKSAGRPGESPQALLERAWSRKSTSGVNATIVSRVWGIIQSFTSLLALLKKVISKQSPGSSASSWAAKNSHDNAQPERTRIQIVLTIKNT
jgi:hypothetical protein